jgi:aryl carrier-like protein
MAVLLMVAAEEISSKRCMPDYGMDSLVAVEMRNWVFREMDATISILELLANTPLEELAEKIVRRSKLVSTLVLG